LKLRAFMGGTLLNNVNPLKPEPQLLYAREAGVLSLGF